MVESKMLFQELSVDALLTAATTNKREKLTKNFSIHPEFVRTLVLKCWDDDSNKRPSASYELRVLGQDSKEGGNYDRFSIQTFIRLFFTTKWRWVLFVCFLFLTCTAIWLGVYLPDRKVSSTQDPVRCKYGNLSAPCVLNVPMNETEWVKFECSSERGLCDLLVDISLAWTIPPFTNSMMVNTYRGAVEFDGSHVRPTAKFRSCFESINEDINITQILASLANSKESVTDEHYALNIGRKIGVLYLVGKCPATESDVQLRNSSSALWLDIAQGYNDPTCTYRVVPSNRVEVKTVFILRPYLTRYSRLNFLGAFSAYNEGRFANRITASFVNDWSINNSDERSSVGEFILEGINDRNQYFAGTLRFFEPHAPNTNISFAMGKRDLFIRDTNPSKRWIRSDSLHALSSESPLAVWHCSR
mmetsp:Transcript_6352/g.10888  ORF Transcript_6352/g.10888 Transcript_6352/m.10888 type:complete len:417 (+) Transcript_6352:529-1779(+)